MTTLKMIAVEFESVIDGRLALVRVPAGEIAAHHEAHNGWVKRVFWEDGTTSWGKSWNGRKHLRNGTDNPMYGKIVRVGAGAYGDVTVWEAAA